MGGLEAQKPTVSDASNSEQEDPSEEFSAYTVRPIAIGVNSPVAIGARKRGPSELATPDRLERPRAKLSRILEPTQSTPTQSTQDYTQPIQSTQDYTQSTQSPAREAIRQVRDLIIKALSLTSSFEEQSRLLDLIKVFREYTEKGRLYKASNIIATQVANLELATRKIETKARDLAKEPKAEEPSFAVVAATGAKAKGTQEQALVDNTKSKSKTQKATKPRESNSLKARRLVLISLPSEKYSTFSALTVRNTFNKAFKDKGVLELVVALVTKSLNQNLVITTTISFTADFLIEKKAIQESIIPIKEYQKDKLQSKVVLHRIPIADFNTPKGIDLVKEEVQIFNKGLKPIGTPYWLTLASKRQS